MGQVILPILGSVFAPAAAGAATAGIGATIAGGLVAGLGQGLMERQRSKDEMKLRQQESDEQAAKYSGAGDAMNMWGKQPPSGEQATGTNQFERADPNSNQNLSVGQQEQRALVGEQYRNRKSSGGQRFRYDKNSGQILPA